MTEIRLEEEPIEVEVTPEQKMEETETMPIKMAKIEKKPPAQPSQPTSAAHQCPHHFGYLSQRKTKDKIPEECMVCENIVQCMLKNVTS